MANRCIPKWGQLSEPLKNNNKFIFIAACHNIAALENVFRFSHRPAIKSRLDNFYRLLQTILNLTLTIKSIMPRGTALTVAQMSVIEMIKSDESKSIRAIEKKIGKRDRVVRK